MADPVSLNEQVMRGKRAEQLLNDSLMVEAFDAVRKEVISRWEAAPARDVDGREWLWMLHQATLRFEMIFKGMIDTGKIAQDQIKFKKGLLERIR